MSKELKYSPKQIERLSRLGPLPHLAVSALYIRGGASTSPPVITRPIITPTKPDDKPLKPADKPVDKPADKPSGGPITNSGNDGIDPGLGKLSDRSIRVTGGLVLTTSAGEIVNPQSSPQIDFPVGTSMDRIVELLIAHSFLTHMGIDAVPTAGGNSDILMPADPHVVVILSNDGGAHMNVAVVGATKTAVSADALTKVFDQFKEAATSISDAWGDIAFVFSRDVIFAFANFTSNLSAITADKQDSAPYKLGIASGRGRFTSGPHFHLEAISPDGTWLDPEKYVNIERRSNDVGSTDAAFVRLNPSHPLQPIKTALYAGLMKQAKDKRRYSCVIGGVIDTPDLLAISRSVSLSNSVPGTIYLRTVRP